MSSPLYPVQSGRTLAPASPDPAVPLTPTAIRCLKGVILANDNGGAPNGSTGILYWGGSDVDSSNGVPLRPGASVTIGVDTTDGIYIVASDATTTVSWGTI